jgi:hypothetical protein
MRRKRLAQAFTVRSTPADDDDVGTDPRLSTLEDEHRILSERRRRLHESIDMLEGLGTVKPDAAARLERYKATETEISRRRRDLYRVITELRGEPSTHAHSL